MMPAIATKKRVTKLAPSELVLLQGHRFAVKSRMKNVRLLQNGKRVSADDLGKAMLAVALLASEKSCTVRLDVRKKKTLFGLRQVDTLYVEPLDDQGDWPEHSLESRIHELASRLRNERGTHEVENIIRTWLGRDSNSPWQAAVELVQAGMANRGALARIQERRMKVLKTTSYKVTRSTTEQASAQPIDGVLDLLEDCQESRPYVWQLLTKQIKAAISSRTEFRSDLNID